MYYSRSEDLIALYFIHEAGWVHRDISNGNMYEYEGRGLLADFEYAKKMGTAIDCEMNVVSTVELTQSRRSLLNII